MSKNPLRIEKDELDQKFKILEGFQSLLYSSEFNVESIQS